MLLLVDFYLKVQRTIWGKNFIHGSPYRRQLYEKYTYMLTKAINQGALAPLCGDTARISNFVCYPRYTLAPPTPPAPPEHRAGVEHPKS